MLKTMLAGALASGALMGGGAAQAHDYAYPYGYDRGVPAYATGGYGGGYAPYAPSRFTLFGARAGVTVLGVDLDASAKLQIGASGWGGHRGYAPPPPVYAQPQYAPQYAPQPEYVPAPTYGGYSYGPMSYGYSYGHGACGC